MMLGSFDDEEFTLFSDGDHDHLLENDQILGCSSADEDESETSSAKSDYGGDQNVSGRRKSSRKHKASAKLMDDDKIRERNRKHARSTRQRKKAYIASLENKVSELLAKHMGQSSGA